MLCLYLCYSLFYFIFPFSTIFVTSFRQRQTNEFFPGLSTTLYSGKHSLLSLRTQQAHSIFFNIYSFTLPFKILQESPIFFTRQQAWPGLGDLTNKLTKDFYPNLSPHIATHTQTRYQCMLSKRTPN